MQINQDVDIAQTEGQNIQFIEVKAGPFYQRLPYTEQGKKIAVTFLEALEIETKKPKQEKTT